MSILYLSIFVLFNLSFISCGSTQLTFELPDNEVQCFYERIDKGTPTTVEFQVVTGGNYDVDMTMKDPSGKVLYQDTKKQYDSFQHTSQSTGIYEVCFSNEFSTYTHKVVFVDWQVGDEDTPLLNPSSPERALTFMEHSTQSIHDKMNQVIDDQTHYRLREAQGRAHGEDLNERVQMWSVAQLSIIVVVGILQVTLIRSFFSNRK